MLMNGSWRTTVFGAGGLLTIILTTVNAIMDTDPMTNPDWGAVAGALAACIGLLFARDNKVSSEQAGVK